MLSLTGSGTGSRIPYLDAPGEAVHRFLIDSSSRDRVSCAEGAAKNGIRGHPIIFMKHPVTYATKIHEATIVVFYGGPPYRYHRRYCTGNS
jgi:hypothetical protein